MISYKIYAANLIQTGFEGDAAPQDTISVNNFIGSVTWTRLGVGAYQGTLPNNQLTEGRTQFSHPQIIKLGESFGLVSVTWIDDQTFNMYSYSDMAGTTPSDDIIGNDSTNGMPFAVIVWD